MLDFQHLSAQRNCDIQSFIGSASVSGSAISERSWVKPRGYSMISFLLVGGGGGGGGGMTGLTGTVRGGGGGGADAATTRLLIPSIFVPDNLIIRLGFGGAGGAATVGGSPGGPTRIYPPGPSSQNLIQAANGSGGGQGTTSLGAGGTAGAVATISSFSSLGIFLSQAGTNGGSGTTGSTPAEATSVSFCAPGGGGAGVDATNTSQIGGPYSVPLIYQQLGYSSRGGFLAAAGDPGWQTFPSGLFGGSFTGEVPMFCVGGAGGGSSGAGTGGAGGNGGPGCGGGGGGGGITGGAGGRGGDGFAIIVCF